MPPEAKDSTTTSNEDSKDASSKPTLQLIADYSKTKLTILHVLCMVLWSGWMSFYVYFPPLIPVLWIYCPWLLAAIVSFLIFSATYTYKEKYQPKVHTNKYIQLSPTNYSNIYDYIDSIT